MIKINQCLNKEVKIFSLTIPSILVGILFFLLGTIFLKMAIGVLLVAPGLMIGARISRLWHEAEIQKFLYWHFPGVVKNIPESWQKWFV
jgi:type IV conjugative transfer system protein TraL